MNKYIWSGIIVLGSLIICFSLGTMNPTSVVVNSITGAVPHREVIFLLSVGIATLLAGVIGLLRFDEITARIYPAFISRRQWRSTADFQASI